MEKIIETRVLYTDKDYGMKNKVLYEAKSEDNGIQQE